MKIETKIWSHGNDFAAVMVCEHCGEHEELTTGYSDANYYSNVIPAMKCPGCDLSRNAWRDTMPPLALAKGVPVWRDDDQHGGACVGTAVSTGFVLCPTADGYDEGDPQRVYPNDGRWRVDLDEPQGQRFAVCAALDGGAEIEGLAWTYRLLRGQGTDADKQTVAAVLRGEG